MTAHAVGADQHQRADGIARRLRDVGGGKLHALGLGLGGNLVAELLLGLGPLAVEGGDQVAVGPDRPVRFLPGRPAGLAGDGGAVVFQALEELAPFGIDGGRVFLVAGVELFDVAGVGAVEEGGAGEGGVGVLAGHGDLIPLRGQNPRVFPCTVHAGRSAGQNPRAAGRRPRMGRLQRLRVTLVDLFMTSTSYKSPKD